jgi:NADPH:quinone reductase-like Zn-dependent oxidoreductase
MNQADPLRLVELVEAGSLTVEIAATYPLEDAARAQLALRDGGKKPGKIVLEVG